MNVNGVRERTLTETPDGRAVSIVDQTLLPDRFEHLRLEDIAATASAISRMSVRGAPLIGIAAAYGLALGLRDDASDAGLDRAIKLLISTRPTAVNLRWALESVRAEVAPLPESQRFSEAWATAGRMAEEDVAACQAIGRHGAVLLESLQQPRRDGGRLNILTHCNAGWLAAIDVGTALAPVYFLHDAGVPVHVWVSETRPRNQGLLTAWELGAHGVPFTLIVDNAAGSILQSGRVDACIVGTDRVTRNGHVCNKIGTLLKALAADDAGVPFYVAAPSASIDWTLSDSALIPIEERSAEEVRGNANTPVLNPGFDVTPGHLVTALITEYGVCPATEEGLASLVPEARLKEEKLLTPVPPESTAASRWK
ncbi:MAG: S-methyl-5-thioribose-1-phosphate isomerase [Gemmatimonadaceae bacterium]|nr:S-methyl-5-thioribose-1-phosphate isomerase [Gemmatimonadaceae bacterium]